MDEWIKTLEERKFRWMSFGFIGLGTSIALLNQTPKNIPFFIALLLFGLLVIFEAIGLAVVEKNITYIGDDRWYTKLWFHKSTLWDVLWLVLAIIFLGVGFLF